MGISASNLNLSNSAVFRSIPTAMPNQAAISRGAFRTPSATALAPSNTAYGTNANPATGGPVFTTSAQVLAQNAIVNSNVITSQNAIEKGSELQQALSQISQQTPGSRFSTKTSIFQTKSTPQSQQNTNVFTPTSTTSNVRTQSPVFESTVTLTGRNANVNAQTAANIASVNANFNIQFSQQGTQALQALQNSAAIAAMQGAATTGRMDGMIPIAAATLSDFSSTTPSNSTNIRVFDNITETFNHIMDGGGHGGGGGLSQPHREEEAGQEQQQEAKKRLDFNA